MKLLLVPIDRLVELDGCEVITSEKTSLAAIKIEEDNNISEEIADLLDISLKLT